MKIDREIRGVRSSRSRRRAHTLRRIPQRTITISSPPSFGEFEDARGPKFSFQVKRPPILDVKEGIVVDKVELVVVKRVNIKERFDYATRKQYSLVVPKEMGNNNLTFNFFGYLQHPTIIIVAFDSNAFAIITGFSHSSAAVVSRP
ncbi:hypothetical protein LXL04_038359 [Taraxacum kok-saghyz]